MRLRRLELSDQGILKEFRVGFPDKSPARSYGLDFLVGVNGSGKSTALRSIAYLVDAMNHGTFIDFPFRLEYELGHGRKARPVRIENCDEDWKLTGAPRVGGGGDVRDVLPLVFVFTAGNVSSWYRPPEGLVRETTSPDSDQGLLQRLLNQELGHRAAPSGSERADERAAAGKVTVIQPPDLSLVFLCGWLADVTAGRGRLKHVMHEVGINGVCGLSLRLHMADLTTAQRKTAGFLETCAARRIRLGSDQLMYFDLSETPQGRPLCADPGDGLRLFQDLAELAAAGDGQSPILAEVNIALDRTLGGKSNGPVQLFQSLSDGEQSFLGRMALFPLVSHLDDTLILLDEPEVHFNDSWKSEIIHHLHRSLDDMHMHVLIATHAAITLTDVAREHIHILERDGIYTHATKRPGIETFGAEASDIITDLFGTPTATGRYSTDYIRRKLDRLVNVKDPERKRQKLNDLLQEIAPGYWSYRVRLEQERTKDMELDR